MASVKTSAAVLTPQERRCQAETSQASCCGVDGGKVCAWTGHGKNARCGTVAAAKKQHWVNQCPSTKRGLLSNDPATHQAKYAAQKAAKETDRTQTRQPNSAPKVKPNLKPTPRQHVPPQVVHQAPTQPRRHCSLSLTQCVWMLCGSRRSKRLPSSWKIKRNLEDPPLPVRS